MGLFSKIGKIASTVVSGPTKILSDKLLGSSGTNQIMQGMLGYATGGVSGAIGVGQDYLQSQYNLAQQKELAQWNAEQQQKLNDRSYQQDIDFWNMQNQYNSPEEQMKRYEAAGLNKNLIYGQSNTSSGSVSSTPATIDAGKYSPVNNKLQYAQLALALQEQHQRVTNQAIENDLARQRLSLAERNADREDALARAQINAIGANLGLTNARIGDIAYRQNLPQSWLGRQFYDLAHAFKSNTNAKFVPSSNSKTVPRRFHY